MAPEGRCISNLRWMQALLCSPVLVGTAAESIVMNRMLLRVSRRLPKILYSTRPKRRVCAGRAVTDMSVNISRITLFIRCFFFLSRYLFICPLCYPASRCKDSCSVISLCALTKRGSRLARVGVTPHGFESLFEVTVMINTVGWLSWQVTSPLLKSTERGPERQKAKQNEVIAARELQLTVSVKQARSNACSSRVFLFFFCGSGESFAAIREVRLTRR